jgi:hypothetical protein
LRREKEELVDVCDDRPFFAARMPVRHDAQCIVSAAR